jgi:hypothetical protein
MKILASAGMFSANALPEACWQSVQLQAYTNSGNDVSR